MSRFNRRTTPKVKKGRVQKKNNHKPTPSYWNTPQKIPVIDREKPGDGYKHFLRKKDILTFISILPDWDELAKGLDAIVLATGDGGADGWHVPSIIGICAWPKEQWIETEDWYYESHQEIFARLNVPCEKKREHWLCKFTPETIRAYQLLHIFLHELGHHHDRMTTKSKRTSARGENYAERYARSYEPVIWDRYFECFEGR